MLNRVGEQQVRCPVCGESQMGWNGGAIHYVWADWYYRPVGFPLTGGIVVGDHDSEYTDVPTEVLNEAFGGHPAFLCCNNAKHHPDGVSHWWRIDPADVKYDGPLANDLINRAENGDGDTE